jgi:sugar O-acyltransferase (sialic acid O-acetyltransferase NeuD family)
MKPLLIVGAGGHGRSVAELILACTEFDLVGFLDDAFPELERVWEFPVVGKVDNLPKWQGMADFAFVAIGNNALRKRVSVSLKAAGFSIPAVVHPTAIVSPTASIGEGTAIMAGAIVGTEAKLGDGVIVNSGAVVDHHCIVGDFGHLGVSAAMAGGSVLGQLAWMQASSSLGYGVTIGEGRVLKPGEAVSQ